MSRKTSTDFRVKPGSECLPYLSSWNSLKVGKILLQLAKYIRILCSRQAKRVDFVLSLFLRLYTSFSHSIMKPCEPSRAKGGDGKRKSKARRAVCSVEQHWQGLPVALARPHGWNISTRLYFVFQTCGGTLALVVTCRFSFSRSQFFHLGSDPLTFSHNHHLILILFTNQVFT